jgi:hypothetical protein
MKFSALAIIASAIILTGCAASGPTHTQVASSFPALKADQGRVFFYRNGSIVGAALQPAITLDGAAVGDSKPGGFFYVDAKAGAHDAATSTDAAHKLAFVLANGEVKYVRTKVSAGLLVGGVSPELVSADEASKEIAELAYTGAPAAK